MSTEEVKGHIAKLRACRDDLSRSFYMSDMRALDVSASDLEAFMRAIDNEYTFARGCDKLRVVGDIDHDDIFKVLRRMPAAAPKGEVICRYAPLCTVMSKKQTLQYLDHLKFNDSALLRFVAGFLQLSHMQWGDAPVILSYFRTLITARDAVEQMLETWGRPLSGLTAIEVMKHFIKDDALSAEVLRIMHDYGKPKEQKKPAKLIPDPKEDSESKAAETACCICMTNTKRYMLLPCKHLCMCNGCARKLAIKQQEEGMALECPICRGNATEAVEVFV